jgi:hypothetical protein
MTSEITAGGISVPLTHAGKAGRRLGWSAPFAQHLSG